MSRRDAIKRQIADAEAAGDWDSVREAEESLVDSLLDDGVRVIGSAFGGGWIVPETPEAVEALESFYDAPAAPLVPLGGESGYIVEPAQAEELHTYLNDAGIAWNVES